MRERRFIAQALRRSGKHGAFFFFERGE
jgi:hypothetical protein